MWFHVSFDSYCFSNWPAESPHVKVGRIAGAWKRLWLETVPTSLRKY